MAVTPPSSLAGLLVSPGSLWTSGQFTFSVPVVGSSFAYSGEANAPGYAVFTSAQAARFVTAMNAWDRLIAPNFVQTDDLTAPGNIRAAFTDYVDAAGLWGYSYFAPPNGSMSSTRPGDIWINAAYKNTDFLANSYDYSGLLHEIGHALGLQHPHDATGFDHAWDMGDFTIMSYNDQNYWHRYFQLGGGGLQAGIAEIYASTPMVLDIAAIQQIYGADPTTEAGDTTYTFSQSTPFVVAIYDAGGIDTIDLSSHTRGSVLDLTPGAYSDVARFTVTDQIAAAVAQYGSFYATYISNWLSSADTYTWTTNLGIAFATVIENAKGGSGADHITGNAAANRLEGGAGADILLGMGGDDFLIGGAGDDFLDGGAGSLDVASFALNRSQATVTQNGNGTWTVVSSLGVDTLTGVEILRFLDQDLALTPTPAPTPTPTPPPSQPLNPTPTPTPSGDTQAPRLTATSPANNSGGAPTNWIVTLTFDEAVKAGSGAVSIYGPNGLVSTISIADPNKISISGNTVSINFGKELNPGVNYHVTVDPGAIRDNAGNNFAGIDSPTVLNFTTAPSPFKAQREDFNGDGKADLLFVNANDGQTVIWYSAPGGGFSPTALLQVGSSWGVAGSADITGDGKADILWRNTAGELVSWDSGGGGVVGRYLGAVPTNYKIEQVADFTGDGKADVLWRDVNGEVTLWLSGPGAVFREAVVAEAGPDWSLVASGDFNGDGRSDVLWRNGAGELSLWTATGLGFNGEIVGSQSLDWSALGAGDFNGDGLADVMWRKSDGSLQVALGAAQGFGAVTSLMLKSADLTLLQIADMDGDGRADLVWRAANGDVVLWDSSSTAVGGFDQVKMATVPKEWQVF